MRFRLKGGLLEESAGAAVLDRSCRNSLDKEYENINLKATKASLFLLILTSFILFLFYYMRTLFLCPQILGKLGKDTETPFGLNMSETRQG